MNNLSKDDQTYISLIFILVLIKVIDMTVIHSQEVQGSVVSMSWIAIVITTICGFLAARMAERSGFPALWDESINHRQRFLIPAAAGFVLGIIRDIIEVIEHNGGVDTQTPLSISFPFYLFTGITGEILFHIFPLTLLVWLLSTILLKRKYNRQVFFIAAVFLSAVIAWNTMSAWSQTAHPAGMLLSGTNIIAAGFYFLVELAIYLIFRQRGYLSAISARLAYFLAWHIIWPVIYLL